MTFDVKEYRKAYYQANKARMAEAVRDWRRRNPERVRLHSINNYHRNKHKGYWWTEAKKERDKEYRKENREALKLARHLRVTVNEARKLIVESNERKERRNAGHRHVAQPSGPTYGAV